MLTAQQLNDALAELVKYSAKVGFIFIVIMFVAGAINHFLHNKTYKRILELEIYIDELREEIKKGKSIDALREEIKAIKDQ